MQTLNKGEWAEFYVFIKILSDGRLYYGDEQLNSLKDKFFDIDKIIKNKNSIDQIFYVEESEIITEDISINRSVLKEKTKIIFEKILEGQSTFTLPEAEELKDFLKLERFSESSHAKSDIRLSLIDEISKTSNIYGFSIKTKLKGKSTLINSSGKSTGFSYKIDNFSDELAQEVNLIEGSSKVNQRILKILNLGGKITFNKATSNTYKSNLKMVDSLLDQIIGELLLTAYIYNQKIVKKAVLTERFTQYYKSQDLSLESVIYKIKNFLNISAIGMTPSRPWNGQSEVDGGLIIVKTTGDLVGYFVFSLDKFKEYLWQNTYFETPSTTRHGFGYIYKEGDQFYFDLNLQVRFS